MQKTPTKTHRTVVFIGLAAALVLCTFSCIALGRARPPRARPSRTRPSIEELDALAKPHFDEAERNVPAVVAGMSSTGNFLKLCWLITRDKLSGSSDTRVPTAGDFLRENDMSLRHKPSMRLKKFEALEKEPLPKPAENVP